MWQGEVFASSDCLILISYYYITVFGDIMVLSSPRPPVDNDDVNTLNRKIFNLLVSLSNFICG